MPAGLCELSVQLLLRHPSQKQSQKEPCLEVSRTKIVSSPTYMADTTLLSRSAFKQFAVANSFSLAVLSSSIEAAMNVL